MLILVDNKSTDHSILIYHKLVTNNENVEVILLTRNFGSPQPSILAGIRHALSLDVDAAIVMDADLQDPPELIFDFCREWERGFYLVIGVRKKREESLIRKIGYYLFYRIFRYLSFLDIPLDAGDFCLFDKILLQHISSFTETDVLIRGLRAWVGFEHGKVEYDRPIRQKGLTNFNFWGYLRCVKDAVVNFSDKPLEYISFIAIGSSIVTGCASLFYLYFAFTKVAPKGFFTLIMAILFFGTLQLICLGVIAEYLIRIFREVKKRPPYIVERVLSQANISLNSSRNHHENYER